jgi:cell wall-associated NlpC family hydrolase
MSRAFARRRLLAVGLSVALATPLTLMSGGTAGAADSGFREISFRDSGPRVKVTQRVLDKRVTGIYNRKTQRAVRQFQDRRGFAVTGVVNARTWNAIDHRWDRFKDRKRRINNKYERIMRVARNQKGDPYVYGAAGPGAFDCSGLTMYVYRKAAGISMQHLATAQSRRGERVSRKNARPGDLVFMYDGGGIYHASIYAGKGDIIHASRPGTNVKRDPIWTSRHFIVRILPKP